MPEFDSAGAGAARGIRTGFGIAQGLAERQQRDEALRQASAKEMRDSWDAVRDTTIELINQNAEAGANIAKAGGSDEDIQTTRLGAENAIKSYEQTMDFYRQLAIANNADEATLAMIPNAERLKTERMSVYEATIAAGRAMNPVNSGKAAADEARAKIKALLPNATDEQIAQIELKTDKAPNFINFQMSDGKFRTIDVSTDEGAAEARRITDNGLGVRMGLSINASSSAAFDVNRSELTDFDQVQINALNVMDELGRLREQLGDSDLKTGFTGGVITALDTLADQMIQASGALTGGDPDDASLLNPANYNLDGFGAEANASVAFRGNIINMAYILARAADDKGRLSENDVRLQLDRLAAGGARNQMKAALDEIDRSVRGQFANKHAVMSSRLARNPDGPQLAPIPESLRKPGDNSALDALVEKPQPTAADVANMTTKELEELKRRREAKYNVSQ